MHLGDELGPKTLRTERLLLRPFRSADLGPLSAFLRCPRSTEHLLLTSESKTEEGARWMLERLIESQDPDIPYLALAIEEIGGAPWIGQVSLGVQGAFAELSYAVDRDHEGQGVASEALLALTQHAQQNLRLSELRLFVPLGHGASRRVGEKCGYKVTGERSHDGRRGWWMVLRC